MLPPSEAGVHSEYTLHNGSHRGLSLSCWRVTGEVPQAVVLQSSFSLPLISFKPCVMTIFSLSYFLSFLQAGLKIRAPTNDLLLLGGTNNLPIFFFLSFALSVFQEREDKERKPKTLIPGEVKRKLIFTIKFFYR